MFVALNSNGGLVGAILSYFILSIFLKSLIKKDDSSSICFLFNEQKIPVQFR